MRGVLQRKCACGAHTPAGGSCASCAGKEQGLRRKLSIGSSNDPLEHEADRVAEQVMASGARSDFGRVPVSVQRLATGAAPGAQRASASVDRALASPGRPLDAPLRRDMEMRFGHDFSRVRVHDGVAAEQSARDVSARAYAVGGNIVFGAGQYRPETSSGRFTLAHELAHVVQQGATSRLPGAATLRPSSAAQEREADTAAKAVLCDRNAPIRETGGGAVLALREGDPAGDAAARAIAALNRADPVAGVGDPAEALAILGTLSGEALVSAVTEIDSHALLDVLIAAIAPGNQSPAVAVIFAVRATSPEGAANDEFAKRAASALALLPIGEQNQILAVLLTRKGVTFNIDDLREGVEALQESDAHLAAQEPEEAGGMSGALPAVTAGIEPGPSGQAKMPFPLFIGVAAHNAITLNYDGFHRGELTFYNYTPISTILAAAAATGLTVNPANLSKAQRALRPDIANITGKHLYEIKPLHLQTQGAVEAATYMTAFAAAGLPIAAGPMSEPGTWGFVPAPGGWFSFSATLPGVITYVYRRAQPLSQRQKEPEKEPQTQPKLQYQPYRLPVLEPMPTIDPSMVDKISKATGLTGAALIILLILMVVLAPVGV